MERNFWGLITGSSNDKGRWDWFLHQEKRDSFSSHVRAVKRRENLQCELRRARRRGKAGQKKKKKKYLTPPQQKMVA